MTKKVISFSLWGDNPVYTEGAFRNAELARTVFPDWTTRFYIGKDIGQDVSSQLKEYGSEVINRPLADWRGMFWRFEPASEPEVDIMISRDCDSRLSARDKVGVDEWLASDKQFHIVRDHPQHCTTILGGLWGCRNNFINNIRTLIDNWKQEDRWQTDQEFLNAVIYPRVKQNAFVHDEFHEYEINRHKINHEREKYSFLGEPISADEKPNLNHRLELALWLKNKERQST